MSLDPKSPFPNPAPAMKETVEASARFNERMRRIICQFWERQEKSGGFQVPDPEVISRTFFDVGAAVLSNPEKLAEQQRKFWRGYTDIWSNALARASGNGGVEPVVEPAPGDKRFKDDAWSENAVFDAIKQSYLLASEFIRSTVHDAEGVDDKTRKKADFYTRQWVNALSPANFAATNPKVIKTAMDSGGESLVRGLDRLLTDLEKGEGRLKISMTDQEAFTLGGNIAATPGKVVFQNDLIQLIQYAPSTETVARRPLLIVPPWINKFYVLDLRPRNSFIKWAVDQGLTVFVISWVNPGPELSHKRFDDYMLEGPLAALGAITRATGVSDVNVAGYCIGGTLVSSALAYMAEKNDQRVKSVTLLTTMLDFEDPGELGVFIDDEQLGKLEAHMNETGYLDGAYMSQVFNMLRDNDLIWSFVVNNYLMGREPVAFDLLYWNSDNTRMPAMMHGLYLRQMYLENRLRAPGGVSLDGVPIDLSRVAQPAYLLSTREDHIAPWKSVYKTQDLFSGRKRFVLSASGHIAGVINPPAANKYCYWTNSRKPKDPDKWLEGAERHEGSWWPDWAKWLSGHSGGKAEARVPGGGGPPVIEDAPGGYVKTRAD